MCKKPLSLNCICIQHIFICNIIQQLMCICICETVSYFLNFNFSSAAYPECSEDKWACSDGECINNNARCDLIVHCNFGSDEEMCGKSILQQQTPQKDTIRVFLTKVMIFCLFMFRLGIFIKFIHIFVHACSANKLQFLNRDSQKNWLLTIRYKSTNCYKICWFVLPFGTLAAHW